MVNVNQAEFEGKVAIVTGAASGIGRATVTLLNSRGASVAAEDIKPEAMYLLSKKPNTHIQKTAVHFFRKGLQVHVTFYL